jgi:hypothetical protein
MTDQSEFVRQQSEWSAEDARAERQQSRPNGIDRQQRHAIPPIDQADVARWKGRNPPDIVFTIEDLAPQGMVTLLTSQGGAGKTLLLQMAGTIVAAGGMRFLGKAALTGKAAGVFAEDPESVLHVRQPRINEFLGVDYDRIAGRYFPQSYFGQPAQLWRQGRPTEFLTELEDQLRRIEPLRLLTLDNAAVLFSGDENSRSEVTEFMSALNGLADRLSIGIIVSAHASKSQDGTALRVTSGSTAWVNACRSVLDLKIGGDAGDGDQGPSLVVVKANHAVTGTTIQLEWRGKLLVPVLPSTGIIGAIQRRSADRVFLDLLDASASQGETSPTASTPAAAMRRRCLPPRPTPNATVKRIWPRRWSVCSPRTRSAWSCTAGPATNVAAWSASSRVLGMSRDAAVAAVLRPTSQALEIACAVVRCCGSCGGLRRFPESRAISRCGGSAVVCGAVPPIPPMRFAALLERAAGAWGSRKGMLPGPSATKHRRWRAGERRAYVSGLARSQG